MRGPARRRPGLAAAMSCPNSMIAPEAARDPHAFINPEIVELGGELGRHHARAAGGDADREPDHLVAALAALRLS